MRKLFFIKDSLTNTISYYHLVCFLIALPFDRFYSELILISFSLHTFIHLKKNYLKFLWTKELLIVSSLYLLSLLCSWYSTNHQQAVGDLAKQSAMIIFPVVFALNALDFSKYKWQLFLFFGLACTIAVAYLYMDALLTIRYYHLPYTSLFSAAFMNHNFSAPIGLHATYLSMFVAFSINNFLLLFLKESSITKKLLFGFCLLLLTGALLQLASRSVSIALLLIIFIVFPLLLADVKSKIYFTVTAFAAAGLIVLAAYQIDALRERYLKDTKKDLSGYSQNIENTEPRMLRWKAALELIGQSPFTGYGTGAEYALLKEKYFEKKLYSSYLNQLNTHNEYLSFLIKSGIPGLAVYLFVLLYGGSIAIKKRDISFASFLIIIAVTSLSENILDLNKGIFFFSFFFTFFVYDNKKTSTADTAFNTRQPMALG